MFKSFHRVHASFLLVTSFSSLFIVTGLLIFFWSLDLQAQGLETWSSLDIGDVGARGSSSYDQDSDRFFLKGSGADIWGIKDKFHFVYKALNGNAEIIVLTEALENTDPWAKAGLMVRESLSPDSANAFLAVTVDHGVTFQRRLLTGGDTFKTSQNGFYSPRWLKIQRRGSVLAAFHSDDGDTWKLVGTEIVSMGQTVYAGLAVTSHKRKTLATATFKDLSIKSGAEASFLPIPWNASDIGNPNVPGLAEYKNGIYVLRASGDDIYGQADSFHSVYQTMTGDGQIITQVESLGRSHGWAKAGIMMRESLHESSANAFLAVTPVNGLTFQRRKISSGVTVQTSKTGIGPNLWLKLERRGNSFSAYYSTDGRTWVYMAADTLSLPATIYVGLAGTSHSKLSNEAKFSSVSVNPSPSLTAQLPAPWISNDVGLVGQTGLVDYTSGIFTIRGSGADIWDKADAFRFVYQPASPNFQFVCRVAAQQNVHEWSKAGIMLREDLDIDSKYVMLALTPGNGLTFQKRITTGGLTNNKVVGAINAPYWLRLDRCESWLHAYHSIDGLSWNYLDSTQIDIGENPCIGLAVTSHKKGTLSSVSFDQISIGNEAESKGLRGEYFDAMDLSFPVLTRVDGNINFTWGIGSPDPVIGNDTFSVRWRGRIEAKYSELTTFYTSTDDGVRLWVNGKLLINGWGNGNVDRKGSIELQAGQQVNILLEYFENTGTAAAKLSWSSESLPKEIVPAGNLLPPIPEDIDFDQLPDSWEISHFHNLDSSPEADDDGDRTSNVDEYINGTDPNDYYNGETPVIKIIGGNNQVGEPGSFLPDDLSIAVTDRNGNTLENAPVSFLVDGGSLSLSSKINPASGPSKSMKLRTGLDGTIRGIVLAQLPKTVSSSLVITALAVSPQLSPDLFATFHLYNFDPFNAPQAPSNVNILPKEGGGFQVSWTDNSDNETGFIFQTSNDGGSTWGNPIHLDANTTIYTYPGEEEAPPLIKVTAENEAGVSDPDRPEYKVEIICEALPNSAISMFGLNDKGQVLLQNGGKISVYDPNRTTPKLVLPPLPPHPPLGGSEHHFIGLHRVTPIGIGNDGAYCLASSDVALTGDTIAQGPLAAQGYMLNPETLQWTPVSGTSPILESHWETYQSGTDGSHHYEESSIEFSASWSGVYQYTGIGLDGTLIGKRDYGFGGPGAVDGPAACRTLDGSIVHFGGPTKSYQLFAVNADKAMTGWRKTPTKAAEAIYIKGSEETAIPEAGPINDLGWVAGTVKTGTVGSAFFWSPLGGRINLISPGAARGINNMGWICGFSGTEPVDSRNPNTPVSMTAMLWLPKMGGNGSLPTEFKGYKIDECIKQNPNESWKVTRPYQINNQGQILAYAIKDGKNYVVLLSSMLAGLVVDGNRDGVIDYRTLNDKTEESRPFRFWQNDDQDAIYGMSVPIEITPPQYKDSLDHRIQSIRDCEDLTRLYVNIKGLTSKFIDKKIRILIRFNNIVSGNPSIRLFRAYDGSDKYLTDASWAQGQINSNLAEALQGTAGGTAISYNFGAYLDEKFWLGITETDPIIPLLFEGVEEGCGKLVLEIFDANGNRLATTPGVWIDIKNIKKMYERSDGNQMPKTKPWDETDDTIIFVHGWRMSPDGRSEYAESFFKRLWHRGFKGHFAAYQWNTYWNEEHKWVKYVPLSQPIDAYLSKYNDSEHIAFQSAAGLKDFVNGLPGARKHIAAHSMGNIVTSEAIHLGMRVNNYALMQAAVPSACYDDDPRVKAEPEFIGKETLGLDFGVTFWKKKSPDEDEDPKTRSLSYRGRFTDLKSKTNCISFFLPPDYATFIPWQANNDLTKPTGPFCNSFAYIPGNASGQKLYKYSGIDPINPEGILHYIDDPYEAMPYACITWGKAQGAQNIAKGAIDPNESVDLRDPIYTLPGEERPGFGDEHSGQFNANIQNLKEFYNRLLDEFRIPKYEP